MRVCRHCHKEFAARVGLGLCRACWNAPATRQLYPPIANFGGADAGNLSSGEHLMKEHKKAFETTFISVPANWKDLKHHPLACQVEFGAGYDIDKAAARMRRCGYYSGNPIVLYREKGEWMILDGRHMQATATKAGVTPSFCEFTGDNPAEFVDMRKLDRQHLNEGQRALYGVKSAKGQSSEDANLRQKKTKMSDSDELRNGAPNRHEMADGLQVSERTLTDAVKVDRKGTEELNRAVLDGDIRVSDAAAVADQSPEVQNDAVKKVKAGKAKTARAAVKKHHEDDAEPEVVDAEKMPVPAQAVAAFLEAEELSSICHALDAAVARIKQAGKGAAARLVNVESVTQTVQNARKALWQSRPTHVCPYCAGKDKKCACCKGEGWTNTATYKQSPAGLQS